MVATWQGVRGGGAGVGVCSAFEIAIAFRLLDVELGFYLSPGYQIVTTVAVEANLFKMARNEEKAQSMLFRFREAQAAELGLATRRTDRRPRLASSVKNLKDCERWRGEILREISRKVSKIQDCECLGPADQDCVPLLTFRQFVTQSG